ncbi:MAG: hypothetical protein LBQ69_00580 [Treponema sp.]|jgi:hypothetical protein|nr:hypothetical protein [Treponema sp.]
MAKRRNSITWQNISANISALRSMEILVKHNKAIAKFACKYLSPTKDEYSEKWCDGKNCNNCDCDKFNGYVSINALAKALTTYNRLNTWYDKNEIITTDMLRLWETGKVKPPLEYIVLLADICSLKIDDIVLMNLFGKR